jgi:uncharacterized membrane protein YqjE
MSGGMENHPGAWSAGKEFAASAARHVRARWSLLAVEGREAARHAGVVAGLGAAAACSLLVAYLFFALTIGFTIAWLCGAIAGVWVLILLGTGAMHVAIAAGCVWWLRRRIQRTLFAGTRREFQKDFA